MKWLPSDPRLAREVLGILAELNMTIRMDMASVERAMPRYVDMLGRLIYLRLCVVPDDDREFSQALNQFIDELPHESAARWILYHLMRRTEGDPAGRVWSVYQLYWGARWHSLGCPAVTIESKLAASLMATETDEESIAGVRPPWECFIVRLPMDLIELAQLNFTHLAVHRHNRSFSRISTDILVEQFHLPRERLMEFWDKKTGTVWGLYAMRAHGDAPICRNESLAVLLGKEQAEYLIYDTSEHIQTEDRLIRALARLVVGICHMAENPNTLRRKSTKKHQRRWRFSKLPLTMEYVLAPEVPIKFDCTEAMGAYLRGERKGPPRIQYVVRGHWRNQAHGPGRMARKRIWIQPYWKGPEDVPRLFREHRLDGKADGAD